MKWIAALVTGLVLFSLFIGCGKGDGEEEQTSSSFGQEQTDAGLARDTEKLMDEAKGLKSKIESQQEEFEQLGTQMQQAALSGDTDKQDQLAEEMKQIGAEMAEDSASLKVIIEELQQKGVDLSELR
jgi:seryl-tRNA synthetase